MGKDFGVVRDYLGPDKVPQIEESQKLYKAMTKAEKLKEFEKISKGLEEEKEDEIRQLKQKSALVARDDEHDYISLYEEKYKSEKQMEEVFYSQMNEEDMEFEMKKPALFRKQPANAKPKVKSANQQFADLGSDQQSFGEMKKQFNVADKGNQVDYMNNEVFQMMFRGLKERQIKFYAFLNKEFNVLNYKSAKCSYYWFEDESRSVEEAHKCVALCREGITDWRKYADELQKQAQKELESCQERARSIKINTDPVMHWISWFEKLIAQFDNMEEDIKEEFSNFI